MLEKEISEALRQALKAGEKAKISTLRLIINEIKNTKIADKAEELEDEKVIGIIQKMARQHKESIEQFKQGSREDLVEKESEELAILEGYLPEQISEEELAGIVSEAIASTGAASMKDMGKVMPEVMSKVKGRADGRTVSDMVKKKLSQSQ
ncbi:MAG: GatB/YqeY domain-containing protein [Candidatus Omnitrophota bacterium]